MDSSAPLYHQVADLIRELIDNMPGPDTPLPTEAELGKLFGVGRMTVRRALAVLREEGLVVTRRGMLTTIRRTAERDVLLLGADQLVRSRMPTARERRELRLDPGVPIYELVEDAGATTLIPADKVEFRGYPLDRRM